MRRQGRTSTRTDHWMLRSSSHTNRSCSLHKAPMAWLVTRIDPVSCRLVRHNQTSMTRRRIDQARSIKHCTLHHRLLARQCSASIPKTQPRCQYTTRGLVQPTMRRKEIRVRHPRSQSSQMHLDGSSSELNHLAPSKLKVRVEQSTTIGHMGRAHNSRPLVELVQ